MRKIEPLANDYIKLYETDIDRQEYAYTPGICVLPNGRIIATMDHVYKGLAEIEMNSQRGLIFLSEDGENFRFIQHFPAGHARPFVAGNSVYVLGQHGRLVILRSDDWGETWSEPCFLTDPEENGRWHGSATSVWYEEDRVYMVMEHTVAEPGTPWPVAAIAPVLLRANVNDDLTRRESWTFASELRFREHVNQAEMNDFGVPFFEAPYNGRIELAPRRGTSPIGWLEFNVARIKDEKHYWYDPSGHTYHLLGRGHTAGTGYAAMVKVVEKEDGTMETMFEQVPSGRRVVYLPMPGGQMRFHILYDEETKLYWLLSTQATDSMTRAELLPPDRYNIPNDERRRLTLHFSKNLVDWCFAGLVAVGEVEKASRHYACMAIQGEDLLILSRSGDHRAASAHNGNLITLHRVKNFRELVY